MMKPFGKHILVEKVEQGGLLVSFYYKVVDGGQSGIKPGSKVWFSDAKEITPNIYAVKEEDIQAYDSL